MNMIKEKVIRKQFETLIIRRETTLVDELFKEKLVSFERNIENGFEPLPDFFEEQEEIEVKRKLNEWWAVSPWLMEQLLKRKEPILFTPYGLFWGRWNDGGSVFQDRTVESIYDAMYGQV